jgi:hypothetical protein
MENNTGSAAVRRLPPWAWLVLALVVVAGIAVAVLSRSAASATAPGSATPTPSAVTVSPTSSPTKKHTASAKPSKTASTGSGNTLPEMSAVGLDSQSERADGVVVSIEKIESVAGEAKLPGEIAGPALRLTILVHNGSKASLSLGTVVVNGYSGKDRAPLEQLTNPGGSPFDGSLASGADGRGVFLFGVSQEQRSDVTFTVDLKAGSPASVFRGDAR